MCRVSRQYRLPIIGLAAWLGLECLLPAPCPAQYASGPSTPSKSYFSNPFKGVGNYFAPKTNQEPPTSKNDPVSLKSQGKPGPELYVALAQLYEESGKFVEAEQNYKMALKEQPGDLKALLGYARLQENQGRSNEAIALYQQALKTHPREAVVYNNLGLCHSRRGKLNEAAQSLTQAKLLEPRNPLYRNNLAAVQVDQNLLSEALTTLREVHGDAAANYNVGYLLNKKGQTEAAEHYFAQALRADPTMAPALRWLNYLQKKQAASAQKSDSAIRLGSVYDPSRFPAKVVKPSTATNGGAATTDPEKTTEGPALKAPIRLPPPAFSPAAPNTTEDSPTPQAQLETPPLPPATNTPQRLPPIYLRQGASSTQSFQETPATTPTSTPAITASNPSAPLPPGM